MAVYYLTHAGIKGMKWGVRRYQNADGSLTPAGKARYDRDVQENNAKKKDNRIVIDGPDPNRWVREDIGRAKNVADTSSNAVKELDRMADRIPSKSKQKKLDLSKMTDQQLRSEIDRATLERRYNEIFNPPQISRGKKIAKATLQATGTTLALASTSLGIALAIKELKG